MKRAGSVVLLSGIILSGCAKQPIEMDVFSSINTTASNWYRLDINVIVDEDIASDKDACSTEIIQHILDNDFHSIRFSFDVNGYPNEVMVDVFTSEKNLQKGEKAYSFEYTTEFNTEHPDIQYNIKDNPEEFSIQYDEQQ